MPINKQKLRKVQQALGSLKVKQDGVDLLLALKVVIEEATDTEGLIKIVIDRNKQELTIPATLLLDYIAQRQGDVEKEVETLLDKIDVT